MATKLLNTRFVIKNDSTVNWQANDSVILLKGELGIEFTGDGTAKFKVGNGINTWAELPYFMGDSEIALQALQNLVDEIISGKTVVGEASKISNALTFGTKTYDGSSAQEITYADVGADPTGTASSLIASLDVATVSPTAAQTIASISETDGKIAVTTQSIQIDESQVTGLSADLASKQDAVAFDGVYDTTTNKAATVSTVQNAIAALDKADSAVAGQYVSAVSEADGVITVSRTALPTYSVTEGTANGTVSFNGTDVPVHGLGSAAYTDSSAYDVSGAATSAVSTHNSSSTAHSDIRNSISNLDARLDSAESDIDELQDKITGLTGAMHFVGESSTDPSTGTATVPGVTSFASGDVVLYSTKEYVYNGTSWIELGDEGSHLTKTEAAATYVPLTRTVNGKALSANISLTASDVGADPAGTASDLIAGLDVAAVTVGASKTLSSISETDGKISATAVSIQIAESQVTGLTADLASKVDANEAITAGTGTKITYDEKGLVTGSASLVATDIPSLDASKITSGTFADARIASAATWNAKQDALTFDGTYNATTNKVATQSTVTSAINALDKADTAVSGQYVSAVSETDGVITVTRADLPTYDVATTTADGLMSSTDKSKLDGIAAGAQVNVIESITVGGTAQTVTSKTVALGAAAGKAVDTSIAANSTSTNLPTSKAVEARINAHAGIDKVGTVTSVAAGTGLTVTGTASTAPVVEFDDTVVFVLDGGSSTVNV